ncbi:MAG: hypothetical protein WKG07_39030 [Hymenobacter sp.]
MRGGDSGRLRPAAEAATESRRPDHIGPLATRIEFYRATVDEALVVRATTFATTLRVQSCAGGRALARRQRWHPHQPAPPRNCRLGAGPHYGEVWLVQGNPELSKRPRQPG